MGGPRLVLGDAVATLQSRGDLVLAGVADAGRVPVPSYNALALGDGRTAASSSWFSLWTANTAVDLISAGGALAPGQQRGTVMATAESGELCGCWPPAAASALRKLRPRAVMRALCC
ncbi:hypothetical protein G6F24_017486 [Rhizopus arrhizus]|nr:hypothetical protein G6F24_017486 [Rhizopus arrhizus]